MRFAKMHGLGNDFVIINALAEKNLPSDIPALAQKLCHRYFGIGADGLMLVLPSEKADIRMRIFNSDGSEPEMCGNGIRCFARYLYEEKIVSEEKINVETLAGIIVPEIIVKDGRVEAVCVDMGEPRLERAEIPMLGDSGRVIEEPLEVDGETFKVTCVSMGNPHCIVFVPEADKVPLTEIGPKIENHPVFPRKTNVEFVEVINDHELKMLVWERGAGVTMACGTGACATAVAGVLTGRTQRKATVHLTGGDLDIEWADSNRIYMTGPAVRVFDGEYYI